MGVNYQELRLHPVPFQVSRHCELNFTFTVREIEEVERMCGRWLLSAETWPPFQQNWPQVSSCLTHNSSQELLFPTFLSRPLLPHSLFDFAAYLETGDGGVDQRRLSDPDPILLLLKNRTVVVHVPEAHMQLFVARPRKSAS